MHRYRKEGLTHIVEVDPLDLFVTMEDRPPTKSPLKNIVTCGYYTEQATATPMPGLPGKYKCHPISIIVSEGKVICNRQPHNKPSGTLIVYKSGEVDIKPILDIRKEKDVWFAVGGCTIWPKSGMKDEGFVGKFADIGRTTDRPIIGINAQGKVVIAVRPASNIARAQQTCKNLGIVKAITLDAGGSTCLRVDGKDFIKTSRRLANLITW